jgi:uncharacterized protein YqjF (DUF2071 family)
MGQSWERLAFLHWPVDAARLTHVLPPGIEPDEFDGTAWVGVTPFELRSVRLRHTLPVPLLSSFPELNLRTYVSYEGKPGIWFLSLDAASRAAVAAARWAYRLPYHHARMASHEHDGWVACESARNGDGARFAARYRPVGRRFQAQPGSFEYFATERYCLYTVDEQLRLLRAEIHHPPWPLQHAEAEIRTNTIAQPYGLVLAGEPRAHFARRQDVVIWSLESAQH